MTTRRWTFVVLSCAVWLASCSTRSCGARPRTVEFDKLRVADTIRVVGTGGKIIATIQDPQKLGAAVTFIEQREDSWIDKWSGPRAPYLLFEFYRGDDSLGHYGIAPAYLVAGSLSRDTPASEIAALARQLGIRWPSN